MSNIFEYIKRHPVIPVYYNDDKSNCLDALEACYAGGVRVFEFVNRGKNAVENFKFLLEVKKEKFSDLSLGIGTIKTKEEAKQFIDLGAEFIVSPIINEEVAQICNDSNVFWIPGCMTPSEIYIAEKCGAQLVKLFPGDVLGPKYLKAIRPLFPALSFMPTGGVSVEEENIEKWKAAGVSAVGLGSKLFTNADIESTFKNEVSNRVNDLLTWMNKA